MQPVAFLAEEIAKDPSSPIAIAHEMARKNGTTPGAYGPVLVPLALVAGGVMSVVDARRRPVAAAVAYGLTLFGAISVVLARMPAFAQSLPSLVETSLALGITALAGVAGGALAARATDGDG
jgi:hypothetical protein